MKAAVWHGKGSLSVEDRERPEPSEGEVLLRIRTAGICGTDLTIYQGKFDPRRCVPPLVPGHEMCGVIEKLGRGVEGWSVGERVTADPLIACGRCYACRHAFPHVCTSLQLLGIDRDGCFAEYATAQAGRLHRLPEQVTDIEGALVEPVAVAVHDVRLAQLATGDDALVVGGGPIGLLIAMVARCTGAGRLVIAEINEYRRQLAGRLGFETCAPSEERFRERLRERFADVGPDIAFDATGSGSGYQSAIDCVRVRGRVVQVGIPKGPIEVDLRRLNFAELNIVGTRVYAPADIEAGIGLLAEKRIATEGLVSAHSLASCGALLAELAGGASKLLKPVIVL